MLEQYKKYFTIKRDIKKTKIDNKLLEICTQNNITTYKGKSIEKIFQQPQVEKEVIQKIFAIIDNKNMLTEKEQIKLAAEIKYSGYIKRAKITNAKRIAALSQNVTIPFNIDYTKIEGIKKEAREKLQKIQPHNIQHAQMISGVNPSDIDILLIHLKKSYSRILLQKS